MASNKSADTPAARNKKSGFITLAADRRIRIFYELFEPAHRSVDNPAPVILLSNSLAATTALWEHFVASFSSQYAILTYDSRFHGRSPLPDPPASYDYARGHVIEDLASDVIELLDALQISKVYAAIGLSIGGSVVLTAGALYPQRFEKVFVVGTKAGPSPGDDASHEARVQLAREQGMSAMNEQSLVRWFGAAWLARNPDLATTVSSKVLAGTSLEGFIASIQALRRLNLWKYADRIREDGRGSAFAFVVGADDGVAVVNDTKALAERAGDAAECVVIANAGHIVNLQKPEEFEDMVRARLGASSRSSGSRPRVNLGAL